MQRILAKVIDLKPLSERPGTGGFMRAKVLCKVGIEDKAAKGFKIPPRTKGRVHWLIRDYTPPWGLNPGDKIVLDPDEVRALLSPLRLIPPVVLPKRGRAVLALSLHNPLNRRGLSWRVDLGDLGGEKSGVFGRKSTLSIPVKVPETRVGAHPISAECAGFQARAVVPVVGPGSTVSYSLDVNSDGFDEVVLENGYLRAVVVPHLGGRIGSLCYKVTGRDKFSSPLEYGKEEHIEFGGSDERLGTEPPGELWDARFEIVEMRKSHVVLTHRSKGLTVRKRIEIFPSMPIIHQRVTLSWKGRGEKELVLWHRIPLSVGDRPYANTLLIPTAEKLERVRHRPPQMFLPPPNYFGLTLGGVLSHNERRRESFVFLSDPNRVEFASAGFTWKSLVTLIRRTPLKLKGGQRVSYDSLYVLGDGHSIGKDTMGIVSRGPEDQGKVPVFICLRSTNKPSRTSAKILWHQGEKRIRLREREFTGSGKLWVGSTFLRTKPSSAISAVIATEGRSFRLLSPGRRDV